MLVGIETARIVLVDVSYMLEKYFWRRESCWVCHLSLTFFNYKQIYKIELHLNQT